MRQVVRVQQFLLRHEHRKQEHASEREAHACDATHLQPLLCHDSLSSQHDHNSSKCSPVLLIRHCRLHCPVALSISRDEYKFMDVVKVQKLFTDNVLQKYLVHHHAITSIHIKLFQLTIALHRTFFRNEFSCYKYVHTHALAITRGCSIFLSLH